MAVNSARVLWTLYFFRMFLLMDWILWWALWRLETNLPSIYKNCRCFKIKKKTAKILLFINKMWNIGKYNLSFDFFFGSFSHWNGPVMSLLTYFWGFKLLYRVYIIAPVVQISVYLGSEQNGCLKQFFAKQPWYPTPVCIPSPFPFLAKCSLLQQLIETEYT